MNTNDDVSFEDLPPEKMGELDPESILEHTSSRTREESALLLLNGDDQGDLSSLVPKDPCKGDALVELVSSDPTPNEVFSQIIREAAEETAFLKASRNANYYANGNFSAISEKRLKGLKTTAELVALKAKELQQSTGPVLDFKSEGFKNVMGLFLRMVKRSMEESQMPKDAIQSVFNRLNKELIGYEDKAKRVFLGEKIDNVLSERKD